MGAWGRATPTQTALAGRSTFDFCLCLSIIELEGRKRCAGNQLSLLVNLAHSSQSRGQVSEPVVGAAFKAVTTTSVVAAGRQKVAVPVMVVGAAGIGVAAATRAVTMVAASVTGCMLDEGSPRNR